MVNPGPAHKIPDSPSRWTFEKAYHGPAAPDIHIAQSPGRRTPTIKRELRQRSAIEPIIGHTKSDGLPERNRLPGAKGDGINAILVGAGHNIRLLLAWRRVLLPLLLAFAASALSTRNSVTAIAPNAI
jgi:IS5 family transposase